MTTPPAAASQRRAITSSAHVRTRPRGLTRPQVWLSKRFGLRKERAMFPLIRTGGPAAIAIVLGVRLAPARLSASLHRVAALG